MGQKALLSIAVLLLVGAAGLGLAGVVRGGATPTAAGGPGGMMGGYGGMMGGYNRALPGGRPLSIDQAQSQVENFVAAEGGSDLALDELIEFQDNYYALVKERSTGTGAFELLVNRTTGVVTPEPGPNMMWNTKYGMMGAGGMMGGRARPAGAMTVTSDRAGQVAQAWLDSNQAGARIEVPDPFYGYFTVHFTRDGKLAGMLSVNGYTGQVWFHTWHGGFIQQREA